MPAKTFSTTSDSPVELLPPGESAVKWKLNIRNGGTAPGLYSIDGGKSWHALNAKGGLGENPALTGVAAHGVMQLLVKRLPEGPNLTGITADIE